MDFPELPQAVSTFEVGPDKFFSLRLHDALELAANGRLTFGNLICLLIERLWVIKVNDLIDEVVLKP